jgi:hypothetical protein
MIQFETKPATPEASSADVKGYAKRHGLSDKEAARIFLKLGPNATSEDVAAEAKLFALRAKSSNEAFKKS